METPKVSIVVPIYNVENHLQKQQNNYFILKLEKLQFLLILYLILIHLIFQIYMDVNLLIFLNIILMILAYNNVL